MTIIGSLFGLRLFSFVIFSSYDLACLAYESNSITHCSQKVIISNPLPLVHLWLVTSNATSIIILVGLHGKPAGIKFIGFKFIFTKLMKNEKFWSTNLIFCIILIDYIVRFSHEDGATREAVVAEIALLKFFYLLLQYSVNFLHPIKFPRQAPTLHKVFIFGIYWFSLGFYLLENLYLFFSASLDAAENILPLGNSSTKDRMFVVILSFALCCRVAFHIRMVTFFWFKLFHGDKDIFSEAHSLENIPD